MTSVLLFLLLFGSVVTTTTGPRGGEHGGITDRAEHKQKINLKLERDDDLETTCPSWTFPVPNDTCKCGSSIGGVVLCDQQTLEVSVSTCYCVTYDTHRDKVIVGACLIGCISYPTYPISPYTSSLDEVCFYGKHAGQLCGTCQDGYAPPVYSYTLLCTPCSEGENNIGKYLAVSLVPLTVFFIVVTLTGFSATAASMNAFIFACHIIANPVALRVTVTDYAVNKDHDTFQLTTAKVLATVYGIWNLDFFRMLYEPFCLHYQMTTLQVLAMDYIVAVYPLILTVLVYFLVKLHDREFRIIVLTWKPFRWCILHFRTQWNIKTSLIDTFATFLILSCAKVFFVSGQLLSYTTTIDMHGYVRGKYLYYDGTVEYFGATHAPYGILAVVLLVILVIIPSILLCLYPCRCFQRLLNSCGCRCLVLHTFMDAFQGCYKNGTNGTQDCRYFAGAYFWARIMMFSAYNLTMGPLYFTVGSVVLTLMAASIIILRPHKTARFNATDTVLFLLLLVGHVTMVSTLFHNLNMYITVQYIVMTGLLTSPFLYLAAIVLHQLFVKTRLCCYAHYKFQALISRLTLTEENRDFSTCS